MVVWDIFHQQYVIYAGLWSVQMTATWFWRLPTRATMAWAHFPMSSGMYIIPILIITLPCEDIKSTLYMMSLVLLFLLHIVFQGLLHIAIFISLESFFLDGWGISVVDCFLEPSAVQWPASIKKLFSWQLLRPWCYEIGAIGLVGFGAV